MAVILVKWQNKLDFAHCQDVYEFVAAAGNVGHEVILVISGEALEYLSPDYLDATTGKSSRKILSSLPLYDVEQIYLSNSLEDTPSWVNIGIPNALQYDYEVCF